MANPRKLDALLELEARLRELAAEKQSNRLKYYKPYPKQLEFHAAGATATERLLMAGNQQGKSFCGAMEAAYHATGLYPDWWPGRRFSGPNHGWAGGESTSAVTGIGQRLLLGAPFPEALGTGAIPKECIARYTMQRGVADAVDTIWIKHVTGGLSSIQFKSYEQGRGKWQGASKDWVWFDEEPPADVYSEGVARVTATKGFTFMTFTPLRGMSTVVKTFLNEPTRYRVTVKMTLDDAEHLTAEDKEMLLSRYPEWEREARLYGTPMLGSGRIFPYAESIISCDPFEIPPHFAMIAGLDIGGGDHPTAIAWLAWDRDQDVIYVFDAYRMKGGNIPTHAAAITSRTPGIPVAWPHDANRADAGSGLVISHQYRTAHVNTLPSHAKWPEGNSSVEAGILDLQNRMETGRFRVFRHLNLFFEEYRLYHREDGKIVKVDDDVLDAVRYGLMMRRFAKPAQDCWSPRKRKPGPIIAKGLDYSVLG